MDSLSKLKPVFPDWGDALTTAGNASGVGDGAALCILTTRERAEQEGMEILGKWVASSVVGTSLVLMVIKEHCVTQYVVKALNHVIWALRLLLQSPTFFPEPAC